ncbi:hypothetical protein [Streptomyces sp. NPDC056387]|uniref:hypothetical protein n=1 Tax=Streptomyces sp. NPDC056387 TaxID=3345803 RepID=UPI0035D7EBC1
MDQMAQDNRNLKAELEGIKRPKNHEAQVEQLISNLNETILAASRFGLTMRQATSLSDAKAAYKKWQNDFMAPAQKEQSLFETLGATQCYWDTA